jgi:hypothetical protein
MALVFYQSIDWSIQLNLEITVVPLLSVSLLPCILQLLTPHNIEICVYHIHDRMHIYSTMEEHFIICCTVSTVMVDMGYIT